MRDSFKEVVKENEPTGATGCGMQDSGYRMQDAGYRMAVRGWSLPWILNYRVDGQE